jgi:predicted GH43/DUF377 family glycosyl hydrolase
MKQKFFLLGLIGILVLTNSCHRLKTPPPTGPVTPPSARRIALTATPQEKAVLLKWTRQQEIRGFNLYRKTAGEQDFSKIVSIGDTATSYLDKGLKNGVRYSYYLAIVELSGQEKEKSAVVSARPFTAGDWKKVGGRPVLPVGPRGSWDGFEVTAPTVIKQDGVYKMWYTGCSGIQEQGRVVYRIGYATSSDGINWQKHPTYVLDCGPPGSWDGLGGVAFPEVIYDGEFYRMWFCGIGEGDALSSQESTGIGYAWSRDGINWTKSAYNPIIRPTFGKEIAITKPCVLYRDEVYQMWYGYVGVQMGFLIGYASSNSPEINWKKDYRNPVLKGALGWEIIISPGEVMYDEEEKVYKMWYGGSDGERYQIGYAISEDGIRWFKSSKNPILSPTPGGWDSFNVLLPSVIKGKISFCKECNYQMWYAGYQWWEEEGGGFLVSKGIGLAIGKIPSSDNLSVGIPPLAKK